MAAEEPGVYEIKFAEQSGANPRVIYSQATARISGGAKAAPTGATLTAIPYSTDGMVANALARGQVQVWFTSDAADTVESEESQWEIPGLFYDENTKAVVGAKVLTQENMTGFTQAGTVDVVCAAGIPQLLAYYNVPRGLLWGLNPNGKVRAYIGDDT